LTSRPGEFHPSRLPVNLPDGTPFPRRMASAPYWLVSLATGCVLACALFHGLMDIAFLADLGEPRFRPPSVRW
jgi:hypothetical protein